MSKGEQDELARLVRRREKLAKAAASQRAAELQAQFEKDLAANYRFDHEAWREVTAATKDAVAASDAKVAEACRQLGVREVFRPTLHLWWESRGENAMASRRAELRHLAQDAHRCSEARGQGRDRAAVSRGADPIVAGGLASEEARAFLASMPTPEALMPSVALDEIEAASRPRLTR